MAVLIVLLFIPGLTKYMEMTSGETVKRAAAGHMDRVATAAAQYVRDNYAALQATATATTAATVTFANLQAGGYLPAGFVNRNAWGQSYAVYVLEPTANNLLTLVLTTGGRSHDPARPQFGNQDVPGAAAMIGARGGYIPTGTVPGQATTTVQGAFGGWRVPLTGTNIPNPGAGHLAALLYFDQGNLASDYLYRFNVPGQPDLNTMHTNLNMDGNTILMGGGNVGGTTAADGLGSLNFVRRTQADFACPNNEDGDGKVFFDQNQGLFVCRLGQKLHIADSLNSTWIRDVGFYAAEQVVTKPTCPANRPTPFPYVVPVIYSENGTTNPIGAVQGLAVDLGASWRMRIQIYTKNGLITVNGTYGKVVLVVKCV